MSNIPGSHNHIFGRRRPSHGDQFPIHLKPERDTYFRDLPTPTGELPFQLDLESILSEKDYKNIVDKKKLVFHLNGDTGGIEYNVPQLLVAKGMEADFDPKVSASENPAFMYITGDCVYFNGEVKQYFSQFYQPYEFYPRPIFAVPGNHDGENIEGENSLEGFVRNFCAKEAIKMPESGDSHRTAMVQPNVYWTLLTPRVNIIGLYSNVPAGGDIRSPQTDWLVDQLKTLPRNLPLIVALHHPIYSADDHHSGSTYMKEVLESASFEAGRHPEMIVAGHVHNYQRLTKNMDGGIQIPYLVTGAGGYHNLHHIIKVEGEKMIPPVTFNDKNQDSVTLDKYSDDHHGFLRMEITEKLITGKYYVVPRPVDPDNLENKLIDYFEYDWVSKKYIPNSL